MSPTPTSRQEDMDRRGKDCLVIDANGRVVRLEAATLLRGRYIPPKPAPAHAKEGSYVFESNPQACCLL